jgi:hypothetical protein
MGSFSDRSHGHQRFPEDSSRVQRRPSSELRCVEPIDGRHTPGRCESVGRGKALCIDQPRSTGDGALRQQFDHRKMFAYYMSVYRQGLRSSSTQTDR